MSSMKVIAIGVSQTGKSTFALHLALTTGKQLIIWDANEVFLDIVAEPVSSPEDLEQALDAKEPVIVYDASNAVDREHEFEEFAAVLELYDGHTLLIDEAGDIQRASAPNTGLDRLYRRAGRRDNDILETTHRPSQIAVLNRALTTDVFLFGITRGTDVKIVGQEFSQEAAEEASRLPDYVYIHYHSRTGLYEKVDDPDSWYIPLNRELPDRKRTPAVLGKRKPLFEEA